MISLATFRGIYIATYKLVIFKDGQVFSLINRTDPAAAAELIQAGEDSDAAGRVLGRLDWRGNPEIARQLQDSLTTSQATGLCSTENVKSSAIYRH